MVDLVRGVDIGLGEMSYVRRRSSILAGGGAGRRQRLKSPLRPAEYRPLDRRPVRPSSPVFLYSGCINIGADRPTGKWRVPAIPDHHERAASVPRAHQPACVWRAVSRGTLFYLDGRLSGWPPRGKARPPAPYCDVSLRLLFSRFSRVVASTQLVKYQYLKSISCFCLKLQRLKSGCV